MCAQSCAKHMLFRCDPLLPSRLSLSQGPLSLSRFPSLSLTRPFFPLKFLPLSLSLSLNALSLKVFSHSLSLWRNNVRFARNRGLSVTSDCHTFFGIYLKISGAQKRTGALPPLSGKSICQVLLPWWRPVGAPEGCLDGGQDGAPHLGWLLRCTMDNGFVDFKHHPMAHIFARTHLQCQV